MAALLCCTYHQLKYSFPNLSNETKKTRATQKSLPFGKWRFRGKEVRRMGQKQNRIIIIIIIIITIIIILIITIVIIIIIKIIIIITIGVL